MPHDQGSQLFLPLCYRIPNPRLNHVAMPFIRTGDQLLQGGNLSVLEL